MLGRQFQWDGSDTRMLAGPEAPDPVHLVLVFGARDAMTAAAFQALRDAFPKAHVVGCSGAGTILDGEVRDDGLAVTLLGFEHATVKLSTADIEDGEDSHALGRRLVDGLPKEGLAHVMVLSDGLHVNGTPLVAGMTEGLPASVRVTGGLAGDGDRFEQTLVAADGPPKDKMIAAVGFYGDIKVGFGSMGGWDPFGPRRNITRSEGNVLYELDGRPALDLYKQYLGEHADGLPATGLLFPLLLPDVGDDGVVRTILAVDEEKQSLTFAGDVPQGSASQLMKANFDRLVDGAQAAAQRTTGSIKDADLAILISCVGRKLILKQRVEDELDAVRDELGATPLLAGFYSYGEICPAAPDADCQLHNQTMTITTFREG